MTQAQNDLDLVGMQAVLALIMDRTRVAEAG
jgi:hypothetical protein